MGMQIIDGTGTSVAAGVTSDHKLMVLSESASIQHRSSYDYGNAFQVMGVVSTVVSGTNVILNFKNNTHEYKAVVTYIRMQTVDLAGGTALPSRNTYFVMGFGSDVTASGTNVDSTILNRSLSTSHYTTTYTDNPVTTGDFIEIDRWYVEADGKMMTYNKEGTIILGVNDTFEIRLITDHSYGEVFSRISFLKVKPVARV